MEESPDVAGAEVGKLRQLKEQAAFEYLRMRDKRRGLQYRLFFAIGR